MGNSSSSDSPPHPIITLGGLILVTAFLYWAKAVLIPLALAILLAFILTPPVNILQRFGLGRISSVLVVVLLASALIGSFGVFVGNQFADLFRQLPAYKDVITAKVDSLSGVEGSLLNTVRQTIHEINNQMANAHRETDKGPEPTVGPEEPPGSSPDKPLYTQTIGSSWNGLTDLAGPAAEGLASGVLVFVMVVFMLVQRENLRNRLVRLLGHGQLIVTTRAIDEGARRVSSYLVMQVCTNTGFGLTLLLGLVVLSFFGKTIEDAQMLRRYALLWGFICGLMRFVPYLGTWIGAALLFAFSVATLHGWMLPLTILALFVILETVVANAIEPLLFGHSTGSFPLALLLAAAFWAWLWGPVGLLLSTPLTVVLVILGKYVPQLHFLEVLLGDEPVLKPHVVLYQRLVAKDQDEASELVEEYMRKHTAEDAYEELILPALTLARADIERERLDSEEVRYLYETTRDLIDDISSPPQAKADEEKPTIILSVPGCPARDEVDELALKMFSHVLEAQGRSVEIFSSHMLAAEVLNKLSESCPPVIVVGSVPPGGLAQTRYLCKRIKTSCPGVKVVIGRWGRQENLDHDQIQERLKGSGADAVGTTLSETRTEVVSFLQVADSAAIPKARKADTELAASR